MVEATTSFAPFLTQIDVKYNVLHLKGYNQFCSFFNSDGRTGEHL